MVFFEKTFLICLVSCEGYFKRYAFLLISNRALLNHGSSRNTVPVFLDNFLVFESWIKYHSYIFVSFTIIILVTESFLRGVPLGMMGVGSIPRVFPKVPSQSAGIVIVHVNPLSKSCKP